MSNTGDSEVVIIGGGIAGLCTAFYSLEAGFRVLLVESGCVGQAASWAGGGILSPLKPWQYSSWHQKLTELSLRALKKMEKRLASKGLTFERNFTGMLYCNELVDSSLRAWLEQHEVQAHLVQKPNLSDLGLSDEIFDQQWVDSVQSAIWMPDISNLRNPRFLQALKQYCLSQPGFRLLENTHADLILEKNADEPSVIGVDLHRAGQTQPIATHQVVVTAGAWSGQLLGQSHAEIVPVRGQMLLYQARKMLPMMIMEGDHYLIPRADGLLLVGSTTEQVGFDMSTTEEAFSLLHEFASRRVSILRSARPLRHWSGLRPAQSRAMGFPIVGASPSIKGLWINTGHYRNGIVHGPGAAQMLVQQMVNPQVQAFSVDSAVT